MLSRFAEVSEEKEINIIAGNESMVGLEGLEGSELSILAELSL